MKDRIWAVQFVDGKVDAYSTRQPPPCQSYINEDESMSELDQLRAELKQVTANHADMVKRNRELRDRPDLGDRAASVDALYKELAAAREKVLRVVRAEFAQICSYCGWESADGEWEELQDHIHNCQHHPIAKLEADNAALRKVYEAAERYYHLTDKFGPGAWITLGASISEYESHSK